MISTKTSNPEELHQQYSADNKPTRKWLEELANNYGCEIRYSDSIEMQECVHVNKNGRSVILIPIGVSEARNNFTIAHELGHVLLHSKKDEAGTCYHRTLQHDDPREQEANKFAAELLMPEQKFRTAAESADNDSFLLARRFGVSELAARVRLKALGITDSI